MAIAIHKSSTNRDILQKVWLIDETLGQELKDLLWEWACDGTIYLPGIGHVSYTALDLIKHLRSADVRLAEVATEKTWQKFMGKVKYGEINLD